MTFIGTERNLMGPFNVMNSLTMNEALTWVHVLAQIGSLTGR
jgi:hypothetical protein